MQKELVFILMVEQGLSCHILLTMKIMDLSKSAIAVEQLLKILLYPINTVGILSIESQVQLISCSIFNNLTYEVVNQGNMSIYNSICTGQVPTLYPAYLGSDQLSLTGQGYNIIGGSSGYTWANPTDWTQDETGTFTNVGSGKTGKLHLYGAFQVLEEAK